MIIMGIDPGTARAGWGIIEKNGSEPRMLQCGCIETSQTRAAETRLAHIYGNVRELIQTFQPTVMSIEELYHATNAKTVIAVAQARGVILLAAALANLPVFSYSPPNVKLTIAGSGTADKKQMGIMVKTILKLPAVPTPDDTADALAIALTHVYSYKMKVLT